MKIKVSSELSYLLGTFVADGTFYKSNKRTLIEFSDGTSVRKDLKYSRKFIDTLRLLINEHFHSKVRKFRKRNNQYVLRFQNKKFSDWLRSFGFYPGAKSSTVNVPTAIKSTEFEKDFWLGVMDCDGMIGKTTKNVTLWSASNKLCSSFLEFLDNSGVKASFNTRELKGKNYYYVKIKSPFVRKYADVVGFSHPRKLLWLRSHLKKEFYVTNRFAIKDFIINDGLIDYYKIFDDRVFVIDGAKLLGKREHKNIGFKILFNNLLTEGFKVEKVYKLLNEFRWKMSKGSTTSIKLPLYFTNELEEIAQFIRLTDGGIKISKNYTSAWNKNPDEIKGKICKMFDIKPHFTSKGELLFDSGVLGELFLKTLVRDN